MILTASLNESLLSSITCTLYINLLQLMAVTAVFYIVTDNFICIVFSAIISSVQGSVVREIRSM